LHKNQTCQSFPSRHKHHIEQHIATIDMMQSGLPIEIFHKLKWNLKKFFSFAYL